MVRNQAKQYLVSYCFFVQTEAQDWGEIEDSESFGKKSFRSTASKNCIYTVVIGYSDLPPSGGWGRYRQRGGYIQWAMYLSTKNLYVVWNEKVKFVMSTPGQILKLGCPETSANLARGQFLAWWSVPITFAVSEKMKLEKLVRSPAELCNMHKNMYSRK